jgi:hypothetical protein
VIDDDLQQFLDALSERECFSRVYAALLNGYMTTTSKWPTAEDEARAQKAAANAVHRMRFAQKAEVIK